MSRRFENLSIGRKLMLIAAVLIFLFLSIFTWFVSSFTASIIEKNTLKELKNQTEMTKNMVELFSSITKKSTVDLSGIFVSYFPGKFVLDPAKKIAIGEQSTATLKNGDTVLNLNFEAIDKFTRMTGAVATVFVRQGDDFVRITTSVKKEDGSRAIGTLLGKKHPAYDELMRGEGYLGRATLFGKVYSTRYTPIRSGSDVIGILFVGLDITESLKSLKDKIKAVKIGETGYIYALNAEAGEAYGALTIHPSDEGKTIIDSRDASGREFIKEILKNKNGVIRYPWLNKDRGETRPREKVVAYTFFEEWNWVIGAGAYVDELTRETTLLKRSLVAANFLVILMLVAALSFASRRMITVPMAKGVRFAQAVAAGDLTQTLDVTSRDEVGALASALNAMVTSLKEMLGQIRDTSGQVASAANEISAGSAQLTRAAHSQTSASMETSATMVQMAASIQTVATNADALAANADDVSASIQELGASSEQMARSAEVMASSVSETSATIEQMTVSIDKVAQNAGELASSVTETSATIEQMTVSIGQVAKNSLELQKVVGDSAVIIEQMAVSLKQVAESVEEADAVAKGAAKEGSAGFQAGQLAVAAMTRVAEVIEKTTASIVKLGRRSEEIGNIVKVINEIADQTNLLALNAAIEAARAGDAGRGFAVVAEEVRKLAERSMAATREIGQVIRQVQNDTEESVRYGEIASQEATASMELTTVAGGALGNIVGSIERTSNLMSDIARMTAEQANASTQVIRAVEKMSESTDVVANAAREQAVGGRQIRIAVERMNHITQEVTGATREQAQGSRQIRIAVENMNQVTGQVTMATKEQALSARQIVTAVYEMNTMTQSVAIATGEQRKGGEMVVCAMENISDITRENLNSVEQLSRAAQNLSNQAESLAGMVATFKV